MWQISLPAMHSKDIMFYYKALAGFCTPPHGGDGVLSVQYTYLSGLFVCMGVSMLPPYSTKTEPNELKFSTLTMPDVGFLTAFGDACSDANFGSSK